MWKIHDVFHVDLLTPYIETDFHSPNYTRPPPDLINEEEEYEVEQVLSSRHHGKGIRYNTWSMERIPRLGQ
jgi:hypothetical protein